MKIISVCVISYNHERFVERALKSILDQKGRFALQIVIGDDCSQDNTQEVIKNVIEKHPKADFVPLLRGENIGMMPNLIDTLSRCSGDYVAFLEGDDYWLDESKLGKQLKVLDEFPGCSYVFTDTLEVDEIGKPKVTFSSYRLALKGASTGILRKETIIEAPLRIVHIGSILARNYEWEFPKWFSEVKAGDYIFSVMLLSRGEAYYLDQCCCAYRKHSTSVTAQRKGFDKEYYLHLKKALLELNEFTQAKFSRAIYKAIRSRRTMCFSQSYLRQNFFGKLFYGLLLIINQRFSNYSYGELIWWLKTNWTA